MDKERREPHPWWLQLKGEAAAEVIPAMATAKSIWPRRHASAATAMAKIAKTTAVAVSHRVAQSRRARSPVRLAFARGSLEIRRTS